jgi:hypothetical protein
MGLFGTGKREWTLWIAALAGVLNWLVGFKLDFLTAEQAALWIVAINAVAAVLAALKTRPIAPQAFTYAIATAASLLSAYGLSMNQEHVSTFSTAVLGVLALLTRGQVKPVEDVRVEGVAGSPAVR